ncbi:unnamed protein product, partial [Rotaria sp. Silwood1]
LIWTQLFKALCRLILLDGKQLINLYIELFRHTPVFQQAINDNNNQRLFGFILTIIKCLLKNFIDIDLLNISKRLLSSIVRVRLSILIKCVEQRNHICQNKNEIFNG